MVITISILKLENENPIIYFKLMNKHSIVSGPNDKHGFLKLIYSLSRVRSHGMIKEFRGKKPQIASPAYVSETACIIGDVEVGENASIWPGAVTRADLAKITVGAKSCFIDNPAVSVSSR